MNFQLNDITIEITQKNIKHIHLTVYPPDGRVKVSAPKKMPIKNIHIFVLSKLNWIQRQKNKIWSRQYAPIKQYIDGESHYFNGERFFLKVIEKESMPYVIVSGDTLLMHVSPNTNRQKRQTILENWYYQQLQEKISALMLIWEKKINVSVSKLTIKKVKTQWGSCSPQSRSIRMGLELAKKSPECLEYVLVHELVHLLEPSHNKRFASLMDQFLPAWRFYRKKLNNRLQ